MMGTQSYLSPQENVAVIHVMEEQVLRLAKSKRFLGNKNICRISKPITKSKIYFQGF